MALTANFPRRCTRFDSVPRMATNWRAAAGCVETCLGWATRRVTVELRQRAQLDEDEPVSALNSGQFAAFIHASDMSMGGGDPRRSVSQLPQNAWGVWSF
jgi:hypothetical protein